MAVRPDYDIGELTLTSGSADFTTSGSSLQTASVQAGDAIIAPSGHILIIASITGQNSGTLFLPCPPDAAGTGLPLRIRFQPDGSRYQGAARDLIEKLASGNVDALAGLTGASDRGVMFNGVGTMTLFALTAFARSMLDDTTAADARATLGAQANLGYTPANKAGDTFTWLGTGGSGTQGRVRFFSNASVEAGFIGVGVLTGYGDSIGLDTNNASGLIAFGTNGIIRMTIGNTGNVHVAGAFSAGSKSFLIDHPVDPLNRNLRHISVEAPEYQIRYRGVATLEDGQATVDIDAACGMTPGTFAALATDAWVCALQPQNSFERVKCSDVVDGVFTITSEDSGSSARVAWEVVARRKDQFVMHSPDSDEDGRLIVDFEKPEHPNADD